MSLKTISQETETEAEANRVTLQAFIDAEEIGAIVIAKKVHLDVWSSMEIPFGRSAEFDAATFDVQSKFGLISSYANGKEYQGTDYVTAWELEYIKMFG